MAQDNAKLQLTDAEITKGLESCSTVSSKIRFLHGCGMSTGDISRKLGKRFQHVRNVLTTPVVNPKK